MDTVSVCKILFLKKVQKKKSICIKGSTIDQHWTGARDLVTARTKMIRREVDTDIEAKNFHGTTPACRPRKLGLSRFRTRTASANSWKSLPIVVIFSSRSWSWGLRAGCKMQWACQWVCQSLARRVTCYMRGYHLFPLSRLERLTSSLM